MGLYYNQYEEPPVELLKRKLLIDYQRQHTDSRIPLTNWMNLVKLARWHTPQDIKNAIRSADFLSGNHVIFNIGGNIQRLVVVVVYTAETIIVKWIGTHAEYSRKEF